MQYRIHSRTRFWLIFIYRYPVYGVTVRAGTSKPTANHNNQP